jgi:asparagine synthase (glutamine-hydrolysing)
LPTVNATIAMLAAEAGAEVLLFGDGADELLAVPRFATIAIARRWGFPGMRRYVIDMAGSGPAVLGELLAIACRPLPVSATTRMYWAANWPDWSPPAVSSVLAEPFRAAALDWARKWVDGTIDGHASERRSWAAADAFDAWWPRNYRPQAAALREASPFLHPDVVAAASALPVSARYDPAGLTAYHRAKGQVVGLFPDTVRHLLPKRKQTYRAALARSVTGPLGAPVAIDLGLFDPDALVGERDTATLMMAAAVERWLADALDSGLSVSSCRPGGLA